MRQHVPLLMRNKLYLISRSGAPFSRVIVKSVFKVIDCGDKCYPPLVSYVDVSQVKYDVGENFDPMSL